MSSRITSPSKLYDLEESSGATYTSQQQLEPELSAEQQAAVDRVFTNKKQVTIITGPAGCGKSTIIRHLRDEYNIPVCATTGKAAMNVGGCTIDSMFNINRTTWKHFNENTLMKNMQRLGTKIIVDEGSMWGFLGSNTVKLAIDRYQKELIIFGDWAQAKPVKDEWPFFSPLFIGADVIKLTECHRQNEKEFLDQLNKLRVGKVDKQVEELFCQNLMPVPPQEPGWIIIYATNKAADEYNYDKLVKHLRETGNKPIEIEAEFCDLRSYDQKNKFPRDEKFIAKEIEASPFAHGEAYAVGCDVIVTANDIEAGRFVNGDSGTITDGWYSCGQMFSEVDGPQPSKVSSVIVKLHRTGSDVKIPYTERVVKDPSGTWDQHRINGIPIRLGPAATVHRSQGMTVDKAWFDMGSLRSFPTGSRHGLAYVAMSRTRTKEGLYISGWDPSVIECDDDVKHLL
jgi:ATP-dependent DNA helicase PIF1